MGTVKNSNMRRHTKFLVGVEKIEGAGLSRGLLQRGVISRDSLLLIILSAMRGLQVVQGL